MPKYNDGHIPTVHLGINLNIMDYVLDMAIDLKAAILFLIITVLFIYVPGFNSTILRPLLSFMLVLFVPGYTMIAVVYPGKDDIGGLERAVLSFAVSICAVPILGFILNYTSWGVRMDPLVLFIILFTIVCVLIANMRRHRLNAPERFSVDIIGSLRSARAYLLPPSEEKSDRMLTGVLLLAVIISLGTAAYVIGMPKSNDHFTELYLLGPNGTTSNYTTKFYLGDEKPFTLDIVNHEKRSVTYDLVAHLDSDANSTEVYRDQFTLADNATLEKMINIKPDRPGTNMRLTFDLYADGNMTAPYRQVYLWVKIIQQGEKFTGFDVLGQDGISASRIANYTIGDIRQYNIQVLNNEYQDETYFLAIMLNDGINRTTMDTELFTVPADEIWQKGINIKPDHVGTNMTMEFLLFKNDTRNLPYKSFYVTTNVIPLTNEL